MQSLEQFKNPHIDGAITDLYAMVYHLTGQKQQAMESGLTAVAESFAFAEAVSRKIVIILGTLDKELSASMQEEEVPPCR